MHWIDWQLYADLLTLARDRRKSQRMERMGGAPAPAPAPAPIIAYLPYLKKYLPNSVFMRKSVYLLLFIFYINNPCAGTWSLLSG